MPHHMDHIAHGRRVGPIDLGRTSALFAGLAVLSIMLVAGTATATQQFLEEAKAAGQVGEQFDGYVGFVVDDAPERIKKMVADTNERRKNKYSGVSDTRGLALEAVAAMAGAKHLDLAKPGEFIKKKGGSWTKVE
jgi:uncharacterized protein YdbL (DUF1318 family)